MILFWWRYFNTIQIGMDLFLIRNPRIIRALEKILSPAAKFFLADAL
jgi:hypothetical protein